MLAKKSKPIDDKETPETKMIRQTLEAARQSDLILLMFDARVGLTADFADIVRWLRTIRNDTPSDDEEWERRVVVLANKLEGDSWANCYDDENSMVLEHLAEVSSCGLW